MSSFVELITRYEADEMTPDEEIEFFQEMIDSGICWKLQGHYGRTASYFIEIGVCKPKEVDDA